MIQLVSQTIIRLNVRFATASSLLRAESSFLFMCVSRISTHDPQRREYLLYLFVAYP